MNRKTLSIVVSFLFLVPAVALLAGCGPRQETAGNAGKTAAAAPAREPAAAPVEVLLGVDPAAPPAALERARKATKELLATLKGRLVAAMQQGGPENALAVCHEVAQDIAASAQEEGLKIRRVTLRVRNPKDAPDSWESELLRQLEQAKAAGTMPDEVAQVLEDEHGHRVLRYAKPLLVGKVCLACHGDPEQMKPGVRQKLADLYPDDRATGYREGDLRGVVSVTVDLD